MCFGSSDELKTRKACISWRHDGSPLYPKAASSTSLCHQATTLFCLLFSCMLFLPSCFIVPSHICAMLLILPIHNAVGQHIFLVRVAPCFKACSALQVVSKTVFGSITIILCLSNESCTLVFLSTGSVCMLCLAPRFSRPCLLTLVL